MVYHGYHGIIMDYIKPMNPKSQKNPTVNTWLFGTFIPHLVAFGQAFHLYYPQTKSKRISRIKKCGDSASRLTNSSFLLSWFIMFILCIMIHPGYLKCRHPAMGYHVFDGRLHYTLLLPLQALTYLSGNSLFWDQVPNELTASRALNLDIWWHHES